MLDDTKVEELRQLLIDKFEPLELLEIISYEQRYTTSDIFEFFKNECLEINWDEYL